MTASIDDNSLTCPPANAGRDARESDARRFLDALFGHMGDEAAGRLVIWTLSDRATKWFRSGDANTAARYVVDRGEANVYCGMALMDERLTEGRGTIEDATELVCLWADVVSVTLTTRRNTRRPLRKPTASWT